MAGIDYHALTVGEFGADALMQRSTFTLRIGGKVMLIANRIPKGPNPSVTFGRRRLDRLMRKQERGTISERSSFRDGIRADATQDAHTESNAPRM